MIICGDCVELPKPGHSTPHLWVIITEPNPQNGQVVIVNITTLRNHSDPTVVLRIGDHPYISHDSVILYADARFSNAKLLEEAIKLHSFKEFQRFDPPLIQKIQKGLLRSPFTPNKIKAYGSHLPSWKGLSV